MKYISIFSIALLYLGLVVPLSEAFSTSSLIVPSSGVVSYTVEDMSRFHIASCKGLETAYSDDELRSKFQKAVDLKFTVLHPHSVALVGDGTILQDPIKYYQDFSQYPSFIRVLKEYPSLKAYAWVWDLAHIRYFRDQGYKSVNLADPSIRQNVINSIKQVMSHGFDGIVLDIESIHATWQHYPTLLNEIRVEPDLGKYPIMVYVGTWDYWFDLIPLLSMVDYVLPMLYNPAHFPVTAERMLNISPTKVIFTIPVKGTEQYPEATLDVMLPKVEDVVGRNNPANLVGNGIYMLEHMNAGYETIWLSSWVVNEYA